MDRPQERVRSLHMIRELCKLNKESTTYALLYGQPDICPLVMTDLILYFAGAQKITIEEGRGRPAVSEVSHKRRAFCG